MDESRSLIPLTRRRMLTKLGTGAIAGLVATSGLTELDGHAVVAEAATVSPDNVAKGLVQVAATDNLVNRAGMSTIDGYLLASGDRALLTAQTTAAQNGIWTVNAGPWTRPVDYPSGAFLTGAIVPVQHGGVYGGSQWTCTTTIVQVDTSASAWSNTVVSASFVGVQPGAPKGGFTLSPRTVVTGWGVPTFRSVAPNASTTIDLVPNGTPLVHPSDPGITWIDVCDADCLSTKPGLTALRLGAHLSEVFIGAVSYSWAPKPLHIKVASDNNGTLVSMAKFQQATRGVATGDGFVLSGGNDPWCILNALGGSVVAASGYQLGNATAAGFVYVPQMAGAPTGRPTGFGKSIPLVYDVTDHVLWAYDGGSWRASGAFA